MIKTKVYIFWDIENVRPQKNSNVLAVCNVRNLFVGNNLEAGFIVVCDVRKETKELFDQLNKVQVIISITLFLTLSEIGLGG